MLTCVRNIPNIGIFNVVYTYRENRLIISTSTYIEFPTLRNVIDSTFLRIRNRQIRTQ